MASIEQILASLTSTGVCLDDIGRSELTIAFTSLRLGLKAWFSTYQCYRYQFHSLYNGFDIDVNDGTNANQNNATPSGPDQYYPFDYFERYSETILHFHHFFELVLKDILRKEHELLATDASRKNVPLYKLLKGEVVAPEEIQQIMSIEFGESLNRCADLIKAGKLDQNKYGFILDHRSVLDKLNILRNRLVHRGTFILPYVTLDEFMGKYVIPAMFAFLKLPEYLNKEKYWQYPALSCGIDPLDLIVPEFQRASFSLPKVAYLKELGRAAYENPNEESKFLFEYEEQKRAELAADKEMEIGTSGIYDVLTCPVCGSNSLVRLVDFETENPDPENPGRAWEQTYDVRCYCCSFEIRREINNASVLGLPLPDYWFERDLF